MNPILKTIAIGSLLFLALVLAGWLPGQAGTPIPDLPVDEDTVVSISPAQTSIEPGSTLTVTVELDTIPSSRSAQFGLSFDPTVLSCDSVSQGPFYSDWATDNGGSTFLFPDPPVIDNVNGKIEEFGISILGAVINPPPSPGHAGGPVGSGTLATIVFMAVGEGSTDLTLTGVVIGDDSLETKPLPITINNGQVAVQGAKPLYLPMIILE
jgi:hypothetical protein